MITPRRIVLITPTELEQRPLREAFATDFAAGVLVDGGLSLEVEWVVCGVGAAAAAYGTLRALYTASPRPDLLILAGIAGSLSSTLPVGEVVLVERERQADLGAFRTRDDCSREGWFEPFSGAGPMTCPYVRGWRLGERLGAQSGGQPGGRSEGQSGVRLGGKFRCVASRSVNTAGSPLFSPFDSPDFSRCPDRLDSQDFSCRGDRLGGSPGFSHRADRLGGLPGFSCCPDRLDSQEFSRRADQLGGLSEFSHQFDRLDSQDVSHRPDRLGLSEGADFGDEIIENMEGAAFFEVCRAEGVPFLELRSISNRVGDPRAAWRIDLALSALADGLSELVTIVRAE